MLFYSMVGGIVKYLFQPYGEGKSPSLGLLERYIYAIFKWVGINIHIIDFK